MNALSIGALALLGVVGVGLLLWGLQSLAALARSRRHGRLVFADDPRFTGRLVSERLRLVGRPDEVRRRTDGRLVPVEWKSRASRPHDPPDSHSVQVAAYCLLLEEGAGISPPYGVVRYSDGAEFRVAWDAEARATVLDLLGQLRSPYDGRADPTPRKCAGCRWAPGCDARA